MTFTVILRCLIDVFARTALIGFEHYFVFMLTGASLCNLETLFPGPLASPFWLPPRCVLHLETETACMHLIGSFFL
jgi:hypothetical protein